MTVNNGGKILRRVDVFLPVTEADCLAIRLQQRERGEDDVDTGRNYEVLKKLLSTTKTPHVCKK